MWKPKWLRKKRRYIDPPTEFVTHIIRFDLLNNDDSSKVSLTLHLPSKRISESHYDTMGVLKKYIHTSLTADQHIEYLCAHDNKLSHTIKVSQSMKENHDTITSNRRRANSMSRRFTICILAFLLGWPAIWGLAELIMKGIL